MVKKRCPECNQDSYSAVASGEWLCPYCESDMTLVQSEDINNAISARITPEEPVKKPFLFRYITWPSKKNEPGNI